uniref:Uncharacterized protein n=1 Tax=Rhizophora mucronata TaxID=61149 RepID=A0A2P2QHY7_RHIMU
MQGHAVQVTQHEKINKTSINTLAIYPDKKVQRQVTLVDQTIGEIQDQ